MKVEEIAAIRARVEGHRYSTTPREQEAFKALFAHTDAQAQRIAQLEAQATEYHRMTHKAMDERDALQTRVAQLEEALRPFAAVAARLLDHVHITGDMVLEAWTEAIVTRTDLRRAAFVREHIIPTLPEDAS